MLCKNMSMEDLGGMEIPTTYLELAKLAIRNCDGVIINGENIAPELVEYAKAQGKAIMDQATEEVGNKTYEFYSSLFE